MLKTSQVGLTGAAHDRRKGRYKNLKFTLMAKRAMLAQMVDRAEMAIRKGHLAFHLPKSRNKTAASW
jgi:hypothetical protein